MQKAIPAGHWLRTVPISHRGLHDIAKGIPENSLAAFREARKKGFPVELDVRETKDGQAVVFHDVRLSRMTGVNKMVSSLSSYEITKIPLHNTNEYVPLLEQALDIIGGRVPVLIEIKRHLFPGRLEDAVIRALERYKGQFAVLSFNPLSVAYLHEKKPDYIAGINIGKTEKIFVETGLFTNFISTIATPDFVSYSTRGRKPTNSVASFKKNNLPVLAWAVHSKEEERVARTFADNIIFESYIPG